MALKLDILANTRQLVSEMRKGGASVDDISDALDDLARDAKLSGDKTERAIDDIGDAGKDAARDVDRAADKMERSFRDLVRDAKKADDAVEKVGDNGGRSFRKLSDAGSEVSDELRSNLGETFSSFRGDLEDLPQIAQDTLGGLAGSGALGGIPGLVATAAGAAGLGLLIAAFDDASEAQERLKEKSADWAATFIEAGSQVLSTAQIVAKGQDILTNNYDELAENTKLWGVSEATALAALSGSAAAIDEVAAAVERKRVAAAKDAAQAQELAEANGSALLSITPLEQEYAKAKERLDEHTQAMKNGADQADTYSYFLRDLAQNTAGATKKVDKFGDSITTLPDGTTIYIDAETKQATTDVDAIEKKIYSLPDAKVRVTVDDRAVRNYRPPTKTMHVNVLPTRGRMWE